MRQPNKADSYELLGFMVLPPLPYLLPAYYLLYPLYPTYYLLPTYPTYSTLPYPLLPYPTPTLAGSAQPTTRCQPGLWLALGFVGSAWGLASGSVWLGLNHAWLGILLLC